jgi:hypothetical protein
MFIAHNHTVNNILDKNPEFVLGLGDYAYYGRNANCWFDDIRPIDNIMKIAIGNHDVKGTKLTQYGTFWSFKPILFL